MKSQTLERAVYLSGVGVHSGQQIHLTLRPSGTGRIEFLRTDLGNLRLALDPRKVEAKFSTALTFDEERIQTLEHLLAVLYVFGINSLLVELDGGEIPILDGSANPIVKAVKEGGVSELPEQNRAFSILKPFSLQDGDSLINVSPDSSFRVTYSIEYAHPVIGKQKISLVINKERFIGQIAPARTFGFLKDVPALRSQGLAMGGSLENALVLDDKDVLNGPLRFPDEFVRHKVLDFVGDISLLGFPVCGHFEAKKAGHRLHHSLVLYLIDHPEFWS
jgi:UDP-3-O-[3-hydroxymyristoyl] N-acetylglucosamine deacetylase